MVTYLREKPQVRQRGELEALPEALEDGPREVRRVEDGQRHQQLKERGVVSPLLSSANSRRSIDGKFRTEEDDSE